jgi:hypothetical protein
MLSAQAEAFSAFARFSQIKAKAGLSAEAFPSLA